MTGSVSGLQLSGAFYREAVAPLLPDDLAYSAALLGPGSEVLGFDDDMSKDHHWGPTVQVFLPENRIDDRSALTAHLADNLPLEFEGYSTHFSAPDPNDNGTQIREPIEAGPVNHRVIFTTIGRFFRRYLALDVHAQLSNRSWLALPAQRLRTIAAGEVFRDDLGLEGVRERLAWYPRDVWLCLMAANWRRISQEEHLMGRAAFVADELGSRLIAARLVRDVMRLAFLIERQYAPYPKWFGTAFGALEAGGRLRVSLECALAAADLKSRERHLCAAYETVAGMHNALGVTAPIDTRRRRFFSRPFHIIGGERFASALLEAIEDRDLKHPRGIGGVDTLSDNTDFLEDVLLARDVFRIRRAD